jgi:protein-tyrosine phosphatase
MNHPRLYVDILRLFPGQVAAVFKELAAAQGKVVIHCSAGRDRTGLVASLLLALTGQADRAAGQDELASRGINSWHLVAPVKHPYERYMAEDEIAGIVADRERALNDFVDGLDVRAFLLANGVSAREIAAVVARCR